ncbi:hypothetical protein Avbf_12621, partial [Armadillidium vulgare]
MDIKIEADVKDEFLENTVEDVGSSSHHLKQVPALEETLKRNCYGSIKVKSEIEVKEEPFEVEEEEIEVKVELFEGDEEEIEVKEEDLYFEDEDT